MSAYHCLAPTQNAVILNLKLQPISENDQDALEIRNGIAPARMPVFYQDGTYSVAYYQSNSIVTYGVRQFQSGVFIGALASDTAISADKIVPAAVIVSGIAEVTSKSLAFLGSIKDLSLIHI